MKLPNLYYREFGNPQNPPLVVLHGLLGSSRNWLKMAQLLSDDYWVFLLDLRNHGSSFHHDQMDYPALVEDLEQWRKAKLISRFHLIGHSLGGKIAMNYSISHPIAIQSLVIVDIAPKNYDLHYRREFEALNQLPLERINSRKEAENFILPWVSDWAMRQFLLTNLQISEKSSFKWEINLPALTKSLPILSRNPLKSGQDFSGNTLFLKGGQSKFILPSDYPFIHSYFPNNIITTLKESGHNPHIDQPKEFFEGVLHFLPPKQ